MSLKPTPYLPVDSRHLLRRKSNFTVTSTIPALQAWTNRIHFSLSQAASGEKRSTSDIRNWFQQSAKLPVTSESTVQVEEEEEVIFDTPAPSISSVHLTLFNSSIRTVPNLPYIPYQTSTSFFDKPKSMTPFLNNHTKAYRDI